MRELVLPIALAGVSITLIFVPLSVITLGDLSAEQTGAATGIFDLMRNLEELRHFFAANLRDARVAKDAGRPRRTPFAPESDFQRYLAG